jgi:glucose/arabinose dehydrogenase
MKHKPLVAPTVLVILLIGGAFVLNWLINQPEPLSEVRYEVEVAFPSLSFDHPVGIYHSGDGTNRLFAVGQMGLIYVFENNRNVTGANIFLDIRGRVQLGAFLGLAFHPNFTKNGYFYVNYLADNPLRTIIAQWSVLPNKPNEADKNSQEILLEIPQLHDTHNGGQLAFGPDGYLYIALGDGDPQGGASGNAQSRSTFLGKILRINVDKASGNMKYEIPRDNPFAGNSLGYREEIYAYGLRNPWRFSFDPVTGLLWAGDVGEDRIDEIDIIKKGRNYGWNIMEGSLCYGSSQNCNRTGLELPIWEYGRDQGNATVGGFVYRGSKLPELVGSYIYGDYVSGRVWALKGYDTSNPVNKELLKTDLEITSFGIDEKNELYICAEDGKIYGLVNLQ